VTAKLAERIEDLEARLRHLKARQQRSETRRRGIESRRTRREDTRRKILIGAIVLLKIDQGALEKALVLSWLDQALTRADDRMLFGLSTRPTVSG
jgi:hypothetical protein